MIDWMIKDKRGNQSKNIVIGIKEDRVADHK
jgi:hypothetical protein